MGKGENTKEFEIMFHYIKQFGWDVYTYMKQPDWFKKTLTERTKAFEDYQKNNKND